MHIRQSVIVRNFFVRSLFIGSSARHLPLTVFFLQGCNKTFLMAEFSRIYCLTWRFLNIIMDTEPIVYRGRTFAQIWIRISISLVRLMDWIQRQFKGKLPRDFRLMIFFMNQFPPSPWVYQYGRFEFFAKICEDIRSSRSQVSLTPVASGKKS